MQWVISIGTLLLGAVISLVLTVLLEDQVADIFAGFLRLIGSPHQRRQLTGQWFTYWGLISEPGSSPTATRPSDEVAIIQLRQIGDRVIGSDELRGGEYVINATLQDGVFITGLWHDYAGGKYQLGGFQLFMDNGKMIGKFIGRDSRNHINHGIWLWARSGESLLSLVDEALEAGYVFDAAAYKDRIRHDLK